MKHLTREQFIHLTTMAGASIALSACGLNQHDHQRKVDAPPPDTIAPPVSVRAEPPIDLIYSTDDRYDLLRQGFNTRINKQPQVIALCRSTQEVAEAVRFAGKQDLPIAVKSGGHSMEGFSSNDGGLVVNVSKLRSVEVIGSNKVVVGPGCILSALNETVLKQGLLIPAGSCATVGIGGLTLGGGYGLFAREYGLTCDHLIEATMVDGNGEIHNTSNDPELLWALKGGGTGNFGVVTEMTFTAQKSPSKLQAHYLKARNLNPERASAILERWMDISQLLPDSCFSAFVLNRSTLNILVTNFDSAADPVLKPLLARIAELTDTYKSSRWGSLERMLPNYYGVGSPLNFRNSSAGFYSEYADVAPFIRDVIEEVIDTPGMIFQVNTVGGKIKVDEFEQASSYAHRRYNFVSELQGYARSKSQEESIEAATTSILAKVHENGIRAQYVNYCSTEFDDWQYAYWGDNYDRLRAVKRKYDPLNRIAHPQSIPV